MRFKKRPKSQIVGSQTHDSMHHLVLNGSKRNFELPSSINKCFCAMDFCRKSHSVTFPKISTFSDWHIYRRIGICHFKFHIKIWSNWQSTWTWNFYFLCPNFDVTSYFLDFFPKIALGNCTKKSRIRVNVTTFQCITKKTRHKLVGVFSLQISEAY